MELRTFRKGQGLTRSFISAFMMGEEQFCARVVADHSSRKHSRPLSGPPLIAEDPGGGRTQHRFAGMCEIHREERKLSSFFVKAQRPWAASDFCRDFGRARKGNRWVSSTTSTTSVDFGR